MKIRFVNIGKNANKNVDAFIDEYDKRLQKYVSFEMVYLKSALSKSLSEEEVKVKEGKLILNTLQTSDYVVLLDDKGKQYDSVGFSELIEKFTHQGVKGLVFVAGGAYGFSKQLYERGNMLLSCSKMTFTHQMIRIIFVEQLYRAFTILNNEPYHHK